MTTQNKIQTKPIWSILCQELSVDSNTNNISLFKILEEIKFELKLEEMDKFKNDPKFDPTKPIVLPFSSNMVILWKNSSDNQTLAFPVKILFKDPEGKILQEIFNNFQFQNGKERLRSVITINGIPLTNSGEYSYSVLTKTSSGSEFEEVDFIPLKISIELKK